jgi:hypothetical protein
VVWDPLDDLTLPERPAPDERVLVAVVPSPADWARIREEHWYRIPVSRAPRQLAVQYLAFYHTARFPELRWQIHYYAPVLRYNVLSRRELLPDEPDHPRADALYYRVELGPLMPLPHPVPSLKVRRITFISTTLRRLLGAREIAELWPRETARDRLWRALQMREIDARRNYTIREGEVAYRTDLAVLGPRKMAIACVEGGAGAEAATQGAERAMVILASQGWLWGWFTVAEIMSDVKQCAERVRGIVFADLNHSRML